jgi:hypothetical protein
MSPRVSGTVVFDHRAAYQELIGRERLDAAIASLPEELRREYLDVLPVSWLRLSTLVTLIERCAEAVGREPLALDAEAARISAQRSFRTVWKVLLRFTSDEAIVARTPLFYAKAYDTGKLTSAITAPGRAEIVLGGWPGVHPTVIQALAIATELVLSHGGRKEVVVTSTPTAHGANFAARWR